jgi:magnesium chelatase subunit I
VDQQPTISTLRELRASGHELRGVKAELRENLLALLAAGTDPFPGIVGFEHTVRPQIERAIIAGHDIVLLGERGQGKTRLIRTLVNLLDEWTPVIEGSELSEHPYAPISVWGRRMIAERGEDTPVAWKHREDRYGEKLATPDTSVGDLIGDVDPIKVAQGRTLDDPETVHYGLVPRTNRGIFAINELPDLAERIQVALLNVLEERDIQIRGYLLRLPLDVFVVASANPEDYTNRGRIITPLKDRFGAEVRTHYPLRLDDELALIEQEAVIAWPGAHGHPVVPQHLIEIVARFTRAVRTSPNVDARSGVSARFAVAATETVAASAVRRAAITGEAEPVARVSDLAAVIPSVRGKVEFDQLEEGREGELLAHLLRKAVADTFRARLAGTDFTGLQERFAEGVTVETGDLVPAADLLQRLGTVPGLAQILAALGVEEESPGLAAAALEFALEGLHLQRRLSKEELPGRSVYGG